jgi:phytanoyl-CoA hydroxylase
MTTTIDNRTDAARSYETEGYALFPNTLDADLIQEASNHIEWLQARHPDVRPEQLGHTLMTDDPFWVRLISDDRLLDIAEQFIGPNIALFASHYISKPPFDGRPVLWHQDGSYWPLAPMDVVTLWLAVDDSTPENGCMRVIPRTQHLDFMEMKRRTDVQSVLGSGIDDDLVDETKAVDCILPKGGVSVHHPNLIHGSNANHSPHRRCGLTIRYIPTGTRILVDRHKQQHPGELTPEGRWPSAFLLRGKPVEGVNDYNPFPRYVEGKHMAFRGCENWK